MYDLFTYDIAVYDGGQKSVEFTGKWKNVPSGETAHFNANYLDYGYAYRTTINSINDNVSGTLAKEGLKLNRFAINSLAGTMESAERKRGPASLVMWGLSEGVSNSWERILAFELKPLDKQTVGRIKVSVSDKYATGETVSQDLEDELDTSPSTQKRQVFRCEFRTREGSKIMEYAGTPRQIAHFLVGGLPFAKDNFDFTISEGTIENEKTTYSDGRLKPGATFNSFWDDHFSSIVELREFELEFIDSNNSVLYALLKGIASTMSVVQYAVLDFFKSFFVRQFTDDHVEAWTEALDTDIYRHSYNLKRTTTVTDVEFTRFGELKSITLENTANWPPFGFVWLNGKELIQYKAKDGDTISDIDRHLKGIRCATILAGDTVKMIGNVRLEETLESFRDRAGALLGPKETLAALQSATNAVLSNSQDATGTVFDLHSLEYNTPSNQLDRWVDVKRQIGWFLGSKGELSLTGTATYTASTKTLVVTATDGSLDDLSAGDTLYANYGTGDDEWASARIYSIDVETGTVVLVNKLLDGTDEIGNFTSKTVKVYAVGTEQSNLRAEDTDDIKNFAAQTVLNREWETVGYFQDTFDIDSLYYETASHAASSETSLEALLALDDTSEYTYNEDGGSLRVGNSRFSYTGKLLSYNFTPLTIRKVEGRYPFFAIINDYTFSEDILTDTYDRVKAVGTTPNVVVNKEFYLFRTSISSERAPFIDFCGSFSNTDT